jgi:Zn/Cd-binding protein ZinT
MKKRHGVFFGFAVLLITAIFTLAGCASLGGGNSNATNLAKWAGTWNAMDQYLDDPGLNKAWQDGAARIHELFPAKNPTANDVKGVFKTMLMTDFKSCVIKGNTMTIYTAADASGSSSQTITYAYKGAIGEGEAAWYSFEGNTPGPYKYLIAYLPEREPNTATHFHFRYGSESFNALTAENMGMWMATVMAKGTPIPTLAASIKEVIEELPWNFILPAPDLTEWAGTWNSISAYFDDAGIRNLFSGNTRTVAEAKRRTDFASCKITGDAITFYGGKDAAGIGETVTYSYKGEIPTGFGDLMWASFEGDKAGRYKYLLLIPPGNDDGEAPWHVHLLYGPTGFEALTAAGFDWFPQVIRQGEDIDGIRGEIEALLE